MASIRPFTYQDSEAVIALWQACGLVRPWNNPMRDIERKLQVQAELFLLLEDEGKVIASVMASYDGHRGWINYLAVGPEQQGKGYARMLLERVEAKLLARGCPKINLQIRSSNVEVIEVYKALGYRVDDVVSMGKRLIPDD